MSTKSFVGFGLGPIQSGLTLFEAQRSGRFGSYVVAEVDQALVDAVRANGGCLTVNVAHRDRVQAHELEGLEVLNPQVAADRARLVAAIGACDEMATAVPSVNLYTAGGESSIVSLLAEAVDGSRPQLLYACENNNYAAEVLTEKLCERSSDARLARLQVLNTVVGKMSGVLRDAAEIESLGLARMVAGFDRAVLVEEFNRILVSKVRLEGVRKGIAVFDEKDDLLPFEEAKLFGHNAIHALLGYLAAVQGLAVMSDIRAHLDLLQIGRRAFVDECGAALIRKHAVLGDPLFTPAGWRAYAEDLLERMTNPFLYDKVDRICRDPQRKLGYSDRLFGTMRECLKQGVEPVCLASGALAGLKYFLAAERGVAAAAVDLTESTIRSSLELLWKGEDDDGLAGRCLEMVVASAAGRTEGGGQAR